MSFPTIVFSDAGSKAHRENSSSSKFPLGQRMFYADGRRWSYGLVGGTTLVVGDLIQGKALVAGDYTDVVVDVIASVGDTEVSITPTTTTAANYYNASWLHVNKGTGLQDGYTYRIKKTGSHSVFAAEAGHVVQLDPDDPIRVALAVNDEVGLVPNEYNGMIQAPITTLTSRVVGVAQTPITNAQYGFVQTWGMAAVNSAASQIVGNTVSAVLAAAGRVGVTSGDIDQAVGIVLSVPTTAGEFGSVFLIIE
jgi:hypothetical protein